MRKNVLQTTAMIALRSRLKAQQLIREERERQIAKEGYTPAHDDEHDRGQLTLLASAYALSSRGFSHRESGIYQVVRAGVRALEWPFNPKDPITDLVRAGALILAELERRLRQINPTQEVKG